MLTEIQVFDDLCRWHGSYIQAKDQAKAVLRDRIKQEPGYIYILPDGLLAKLGIECDHEYSAADLALAGKINGRCIRRIKWAKP